MDKQTQRIAKAFEALRRAVALFDSAAKADGPRPKTAVAEMRNHTLCFIEMLDDQT